MTKEFLPRVSKQKRQINPIDYSLHADIIKRNDQRLLEGARQLEIDLDKIQVKEQVRTKFVDQSIKKLAENIKMNGLIQPLVVHLEKGQYWLLCGERRYRALQLLESKKAQCFVLENKSKEELMAIQFSENSAREKLHYIDKAEGIYNYHQATGASERQIQQALNISKSEVHRSLILGRLPKDIKAVAKQSIVEKYVLLEFLKIESESLRKVVELKIVNGEIKKRSQLKAFLKEQRVIN